MDEDIISLNGQGFFDGEINSYIEKLERKPIVFILVEHQNRRIVRLKKLKGYDLGIWFTCTTSHRGSAVYVRSDTNYVTRWDLSKFSKERIFEAASLEIPSMNLVVTGVYSNENKAFNETLREFVEYILKTEPHKYHVIGGDININMIDDTKKQTRVTKEILSTNNLFYSIRVPTHIKGGCLDNFITDFEPISNEVDEATRSLSDHYVIKITLRNQINSQSTLTNGTLTGVAPVGFSTTPIASTSPTNSANSPAADITITASMDGNMLSQSRYSSPSQACNSMITSFTSGQMDRTNITNTALQGTNTINRASPSRLMDNTIAISKESNRMIQWRVPLQVQGGGEAIVQINLPSPTTGKNTKFLGNKYTNSEPEGEGDRPRHPPLGSASGMITPFMSGLLDRNNITNAALQGTKTMNTASPGSLPDNKVVSSQASILKTTDSMSEVGDPSCVNNVTSQVSYSNTNASTSRSVDVLSNNNADSDVSKRESDTSTSGPVNKISANNAHLQTTNMITTTSTSDYPSNNITQLRTRVCPRVYERFKRLHKFKNYKSTNNNNRYRNYKIGTYYASLSRPRFRKTSKTNLN